MEILRMETLKLNRSLVFLALVAAVSGCSKETEDALPTMNNPPELTVKLSSLSVEENATAKISFNVLDDTTDFENMVFIIEGDDLAGSVVIDSVNKELIYTAPVLDSLKQINTGFTLAVKDENGSATRKQISINVTDIDSVVEIEMLPPSESFGFENTKTPTDINMWVMEGQESITFRYLIDESDGDTVEVDFSVSEGYIFNNDVVATLPNTSELEIKLPIPMISVASQDFILQTIFSDNDGAVSTNFFVTVVNDVDLRWLPESDKEISETNGGTIFFTSSESADYNVQYSVNVTDNNGDKLDFVLPYVFDAAAGEIVFDSSPGFQGDRNVVVTLTASNEIPNGEGEIFNAVSETTYDLVVRDDRDDGFISAVEQYYSNVAMFDVMRTRGDEVRVVSSLSTYLMLNDWVTLQSKVSIEELVKSTIEQEAKSLDEEVLRLNALVGTGGTNEESNTSFSDFEAAVYSFGNITREVIHDWQVDVISKNAPRALELGLISRGGDINRLFGNASHYVGNAKYGFFNDDNGAEWRLLPEFNYLAVVNVTDNFCF
jgi:hypothetical protein